MAGGLFLWSMMVLVLGSLAFAQERQDEQADDTAVDPNTTTRVTLGSSSGTPGTMLIVPIYMTPAQGVAVGRLQLGVNFVSANLKFSKLERGIAAEMGNVEISTDLQVGENDDGVETSTLTITASFSSEEPPAEGIPSGLLAYLTLRIEEEGRQATITLRASAEGSELGTNKPLEDLRVVDSTVNVLAPGTEPIVACFFFTH